MKRLYTLLTLALTAFVTVSAQWNTNATPVSVYDATGQGDYFATNPKAVRTADKKTWLAWHTWDVKPVNGINRLAVRTFLQLLDRDGVPQFDEPLMVNDHLTPSWWSDYGLQVAADGSAIVTVADARTEEGSVPDTQDNMSTFTPAIYKIDQEGNFLWGLDGVEYRQYLNAPYTNCFVNGDDTYFVFYSNSYDDSGVADDMTGIGMFIQRINDDGTTAWPQPRKWADELNFPTFVPSTDGEFLLIESSPLGSVAHRLNRELEEVWGEPVVFDDNSTSDKSMTPYRAVPDGQGGAAVCFVRAMGGFAHNVRVQHIYGDGALGFGLTGLDVANTEDNDYDYCSISVNPRTEEILVDFESQLEDSYNVMLQKFSYDGDYLFDELGLSIASKGPENAYAFGLVGSGALENGDWIVAYRDVQAWGANTSFVIRRYDSEGKRVWTRTIGRNLDPSGVTFIVEKEASYLFYREYSASKNPGITIFRMNHDGSYTVTYSDDTEDPEVTGISDVALTGDAATRFFSLDGKQLAQPQRGLTLQRTADGTVRKQLR